MSTIYLITEGSYSDCQVVAAYSTKEKAQAAIDWTGTTSGEVSIEEYDLDPPIPQENRWPFQITMETESGNITSVIKGNRPFSADWSEEMKTSIYDAFYWKPAKLMINCWADDEEQAKKIATEKRQEYIAKKALEGK